jgi:hypothetical protein
MAMNMNNNVRRNNNRNYTAKTIKTIAIVNRNGKAVIYNGTTDKYQVITADSTSIAAVKALVTVLDNIDKEDNTITKIILPRALSFAAQSRYNQLIGIRNNNYVSENGEVQYTSEYIDSLIYTIEMKNWLTTQCCQYAFSGSNNCTAEDTACVQNAWKVLDTIEKPEVKQTIKRPLQRPVRPAKSNVVIAELTDIL